MVDNDKLTALFVGKNEVIVKQLTNLLMRLPKLEKALNDSINAALIELLADGALTTKRLDAVLFQLENDIYEALTVTGYTKAVNAFTADFEDVQKYNGRIAKLVNDITIKPKDFNPLRVSTAEVTVNKLVNDGLTSAFINPVKQIVITQAVAGSTLKQAQTVLRESLAGTNGETRLHNYINSTARDAVFQFDGGVNAQIATLYQLDDFIYAGSILPPEKGKEKKVLKNTGSRPQCIRWVGKGLIKGTELNAEIRWAYNNGRGMIAGTNRGNFTVNRGGWGCRHQAIPVASDVEIDVPKDGYTFDSGGE
jgi:hypothetical protein